MNNSTSNCGCACDDKDIHIVFSCAGSANVGQLSYQAFLELGKQGVAQTSCLAGLGANLQGFIVATKDAKKTIMIDGCPVSCGKKIFERHGFTPSVHIVLTEHGYKKGSEIYTAKDVENFVALIVNKFE